MIKYFAITKGRLMENTVFRIHTLVTFIGNLIYLIIVYFLWKAIFANSPSGTIHGMTFQTTFIYLAMASTIFTLLMTWTEWNMSYSMINGGIILDFLKPMDYQVYLFFNILGRIAINFLLVFIPTFILILCVSGGGITFGVNVLVFLLTLVFAMGINFLFDFSIGTLCFYTESTWGISIIKEVIVMLLSGAIVPIPFFPEVFQSVVEWLPFQAVYNLPLQVLINKDFSAIDYVRILGIQVLWLVVLFALTRVFFKRASKVITVNGG